MAIAQSQKLRQFRPAILAAELKGNAAHDQCNQEQEQGRIKSAEHGGVPVRKGGKSGPAGGDQPDFIPIPVRTDGIDDGPALGIGLAQEGQEHAHPEIEAFQEEEPDLQDGDQDKPDNVEIHISAPVLFSFR